jgi:hypothetical protein
MSNEESTPATHLIIGAGGIYLAVLAILLLYGLLCIWPLAAGRGAEPTTPPAGGGAPASAAAGATGPPQSAAAPVGATTTTSTVSPATTSFPPQTRGVVPPTDTTKSVGRTSTKADQQKSEAGAAGGSPAKRPSPPLTVGLLWFEIGGPEQGLLLLVLLSGALGACVHAIRSYAWYVGSRTLTSSWLLMYLTMPLVGALLAYVFYVVARGGFFAGDANVRSTSPFGFAATAALVGMFSEQAVLKLKDVADTLFSKPAPGRDSTPQGESAALGITSTTPPTLGIGAVNPVVTLTGSGFTPGSTASIAGTTRELKFINGTSVTIALTAQDVGAKATLEIKVTNPGGGSALTHVTVQ